MTPRIELTSPASDQALHACPADSLTLSALTNEHQAEALDFLSVRPVHTVNLVSMIRDNGLESSLNRGTFYACRNRQGQIEGLALIGHATLIETRTDRALEALAEQAQCCTHTHMILGERERVEEFWNYYSEEDGQSMRLACREFLFELSGSVEARTEVQGLRLATLDDLELVAPVQAQMAEAESGVNPMEKDPEGFRRRCARRINLGRVWVLVVEGKLIFKADVQADTPDVSYLEGIYVNPDERDKGYGLRCLSQVSRNLLKHRRSICLLVNEENTAAHALYLKAGFKLQSCYDTIFLQ